MPRWPDDLVEGFDAGLAVGMIALFWQQRLLGLLSQQQSWKLGGVLSAFWPACAQQALGLRRAPGALLRGVVNALLERF